jgi:hypothetical protein
MAFFTIGLISVSRTNCTILFNEGGFPNGAILWDNNQQPLSSSELILRSMWLSLASKAMEEKWQVEVSTDGTGLATGISVLKNTTTGSSILPPTTDTQMADLVQQLLDRQQQSLVGAVPSTK